MQFSYSSTLESTSQDCLVLVLAEDSPLSGLSATVNDTLNNQIQSLLEDGAFLAKSGDSLLIPVQNATYRNLLLIGKGKTEAFKPTSVKKCLQAISQSLSKTRFSDIAIDLSVLQTEELKAENLLRIATESLSANTYRFDQFKSEKAEASSITSINLLLPEVDTPSAQQAIAIGQATATGMALTRDLGNLPGNVCTPAYLAERAQALAEQYASLSVTVLDEEEIKNAGMGAFYSVAKGSDQPAKLIILEYKGNGESAPHALVGKGITFDSGGISLKPGEQMDEMKYDMGGAASVLGTMQAIADIKPKLNIVALIAAAENMPSGGASKPGDIVTTLSGQTVEILNTDAEGRLVLCDTLTYAERFKPASVVDIATLTGACIIALGNHVSGMLANDDDIADELNQAGLQSMDKVWRLPLFDEYQAQLDSNFADMQNIGGRPAGTITAACFLSRFTKSFKWAHLDIAGTAWLSGKDKGSTGRPVPLLVQYLLNKAQ